MMERDDQNTENATANETIGNEDNNAQQEDEIIWLDNVPGNRDVPINIISFVVAAIPVDLVFLFAFVVGAVSVGVDFFVPAFLTCHFIGIIIIVNVLVIVVDVAVLMLFFSSSATPSISFALMA